MKRRIDPNEAKICIEDTVMLVSDARSELDRLEAEDERLAQAIATAKEVAKPSTEQVQAREKDELAQRLNSIRAERYRDALKAQFPQLITTSY
jgi:hypothetical protein